LSVLVAWDAVPEVGEGRRSNVTAIHADEPRIRTADNAIQYHYTVIRRVGTATGYGLDDRRDGVPVPVGARISFPPSVQTVSEAHPASYLLRTGRKAAGART
jgi:hypothetical protein